MIRNYYQATIKNQESYPVASGKIQTEIVVIGGGLAGLSTAIELREKGYEVVVLERNTVGYGASGRNGGQAIVDVACGIKEIADIVGWDDARKIFSYTVEGIQIIRERVKKDGIDCDLVDGTLTVAQKKRHDQELNELAEVYQKLDLPIELWDKQKTRDNIGTELYTSALYDPTGLHLHPLNYTIGLAKVATQLGVKVYEGSRVLRYKEGDGKVSCKIVTSKGSSSELEAEKLVMAVNYENKLNNYLSSRIMPVGTYIAATIPLGEERARKLIRNNAGICDMNFVLDYYRFSSDWRLLFGGRVSYSGFEPLNMKKSLYQRMVRVFPEFKEYQPQEIFEYAWGGKVDITMNRAPHFGQLGERVYFLQGFSGHGVALTNVAGRIVAEAISGEPERLNLFKKISHQHFFGGKYLRVPSLVLGIVAKTKIEHS